jgi:membrane-bound ClpP family serine protease
MIFWIILTWGSVLILVPKFGFTRISIANLVVASTIVVTIYLVKQTIKFNFLSNIYQPLIASLIMAVAVYFLSANLPNNFQSLGALVLVAGIIYLAVMFLLGRKALLNDLKIIVKSFKHD